MRFLRAGAAVIALLGVIDPVIAVTRRAPLPLEIRLPNPDDPQYADAERLKEEVITRLARNVSIEKGEEPRAVVAIGNAWIGEPPPVPVFAIATRAERGTLRGVDAPVATAVRGQSLRISSTFHAAGLRGTRTRFTLSSGSANLGSLEHVWASDDEAFRATFDAVPAVPGIRMLRLSARGDDRTGAEVDVPVVVEDRQLHVLVIEARPSWSAAFIRRALEGNPLFQAVGLTRSSRGILTRTDGGPATVSDAVLDNTDATVVSGLEALSSSDIAALEQFVRVRGGTVILVPDAKVPQNLLSAFELPQLDEVLLDTPIETSIGGLKVFVSELLLGRSRPDMRPLATVRHGGADRAAVVATSRGAGHVVLWGALDSWRYRARDSSKLAEAWQSLTADAAMAADRRIAITLEPAVCRPGHLVTAHVTTRQAAWTAGSGAIELPAVSASLESSSGVSEPLRLWPGTTAGRYFARFRAPADGVYSVRVVSADRVDHAPLLVDTAAALPHPDMSTQLALVSRITGGTSVGASGLGTMLNRIEEISRPTVAEAVRPLRSAWWLVPFAGLLSVEWIIRRRRGLR